MENGLDISDEELGRWVCEVFNCPAKSHGSACPTRSEADVIAARRLIERAWWRGVDALAEAANNTADEDCHDLEGSTGRLGGLLIAVGQRRAPEEWGEFMAPDRREPEPEPEPESETEPA